MAKSVQDQLQTILDQYAGQLSGTIEKTFNSVGKETKEMVKDLSPKQSGNYAAGWTMTRTKKGSASKLIGGCTVIIKNAKHYQLTHLLENGADIVMLDNMSGEEVKKVIDELEKLDIRQNSLIEVSGGITKDNIMDYVEYGVDIISIGALTHSSRSLNFSLRIE